MITKKDYIKILNFYKLKIPETNKLLKEKASNILAIKLCRCLRKKDSKKQNLSVGICSNSIFSKKGLERKKFTCKTKEKVVFGKLRNSAKLTRKNINKKRKN
jgi:hypothetical protein